MNTTKRVVLVLGAGASRPYDFPLGTELVEYVLNLSKKETELLDRAGIDPHAVARFQNQLRLSKVGSVDRFLECRSGSSGGDFDRVGKALIAIVLSRFELTSTLHSASSHDEGRAGRRWYHYLFDRLVDAPDPEASLGASHITIITFNYDRSLEFWFLEALQARYGWDRGQALKALSRLRIIHLHGTLGGTPVEPKEYREYGPVGSAPDLNLCIENLHIVHEVNPETQAWQQAKEHLRRASWVAFLGFGYLKSNLERLQIRAHCLGRHGTIEAARLRALGEGVPNDAHVGGTRKGITASELSNDVLPVLGLQPRAESHFIDTDVLGWLRDNVPALKRTE